MFTDFAILRSTVRIVHPRCLYLEMSTPVVSVLVILLFPFIQSPVLSLFPLTPAPQFLFPLGQPPF
jgi:hypothetical protein